MVIFNKNLEIYKKKVLKSYVQLMKSFVMFFSIVPCFLLILMFLRFEKFLIF